MHPSQRALVDPPAAIFASPHLSPAHLCCIRCEHHQEARIASARAKILPSCAQMRRDDNQHAFDALTGSTNDANDDRFMLLVHGTCSTSQRSAEWSPPSTVCSLQHILSSTGAY